jgi:diguanylate cyclase (GGDEF)-like protein
MPQNAEPTALSRTLANTETLQLAELHMLDAFCTPIEERFERITRLARRALGWSVVAITTVTHDTQWFKSVVGWDVAELAIAKSLCARTIDKAQPVVVPDLLRFARYANHPLVTGPTQFRCYIGAPLLNAKNTVIGTFCAMDYKTRQVTRADYQTLLDLAELAERELLTAFLHTAQSALVSKLSIARRQALLDPLTKTWNRRGGTLLLEESIAESKKLGKSVAVLAVDLNNFKSINDTYGHIIGDLALQMVAKELLSCARNIDGVCRFGGDEFFVVITGVDESTIGKVADRAKQRIAQQHVKAPNGKNAAITVSIGAAWAAADHNTTADALIEKADQALYVNKRENELRVEL